LGLHEIRERRGFLLAIQNIVLIVALGSLAFGLAGRISSRPPLQSFVSRDIDATALRPQQQLAVRDHHRSIRSSSSCGTSAVGVFSKWARRRFPERLTLCLPQTLSAPGYLDQRTSCPRAPPRVRA